MTSSVMLLRYASSGLLLVTAGRYAWSQGVAWLETFPPAQAVQGTSDNGPIQQIEAAAREREDLIARLKAEQEERDSMTPVEEQAQTKRLVVDWGPERSQVFIGGTMVGRTPYGGQIACKAGQPVKITLLPPVGAPQEKVLLCNEETVDKPTPQQASDLAAALPGMGKQAFPSGDQRNSAPDSDPSENKPEEAMPQGIESK